MAGFVSLATAGIFSVVLALGASKELPALLIVLVAGLLALGLTRLLRPGSAAKAGP